MERGFRYVLREGCIEASYPIRRCRSDAGQTPSTQTKPNNNTNRSNLSAPSVRLLLEHSTVAQCSIAYTSNTLQYRTESTKRPSKTDCGMVLTQRASQDSRLNYESIVMSDLDKG